MSRLVRRQLHTESYLKNQLPRIASLTQDRNTSKHQAQENSEAIKSAEGKIKQLELDLHTAQVHIQKLEQQKIELSSAAWSFRDEAERSRQVLKEAWTVLR